MTHVTWFIAQREDIPISHVVVRLPDQSVLVLRSWRIERETHVKDGISPFGIGDIGDRVLEVTIVLPHLISF